MGDGLTQPLLAVCDTSRCAGRVSALYVHVPFCKSRCVYCDFATTAAQTSDARIDAYLKSLTTLIVDAAEIGLLDNLATAYIGGGTPTFVGAKRLSRLLEIIREHAPLLSELTVEGNPESVDKALLTRLCSVGVTRLSLGVQSLEDDELNALGRIHDGLRARQAIYTAVSLGLSTSADLMCAIPCQTDLSWTRSLLGVIDLGVNHVSVYPLAIEEGTPLAARIEAEGDQAHWNDPDLAATRMELAENLLTSAGFGRYEVASYARSTHQCMHNIAYWTGKSYLGVGLASASMLDANTYDQLRESLLPQLPIRDRDCGRVRLVATSTMREFVTATSWSNLHFALEFLTPRQAVAEDLMLGMRMTAGVGEQLISEADALIGSDVKTAFDRALSSQLVILRDGRITPSAKGWLLGNELYGLLWDLGGGPVNEASC